MKLAFAIAALLSVAFCDAQRPNTLSSQEKKEGFTQLFDGKTLTGWHTYLKPAPQKAWLVRDNTIVMDSSSEDGHGDLVTDREFTNFELRVQWKISPAGNSGIIFCIHEDPKIAATYRTGPEMQVLDNIRATDNKKDNHLAGSLYDLIAAPATAGKPVGEWNDAVVRIKDGQLDLWLNGVKTASVLMGSDAWNNLVAASKFKTWEGFGKYRTGHIALQDHGHEVAFRNIRVREL